MMKQNRSTLSCLRRLTVAPACALFAISSAWAQQAAQPSATSETTAEPTVAKTIKPEEAAAAKKDSEEVVKLSPFQVTASTKDVGYYAENTLAGSRLNTNVGDLAASITVVTKQQLVDTAAVDVNDVFAYEANTEGTRNYYSPINLNRSAVKDTMNAYSADDGTSYTNATSNRIRGVSNASTGQDNYQTISRLPFDTYNTQSIEINRGPNSLLFGMGQPAGIVNQSTTQAVLNKRKTSISTTISSFGGFRASLSHNMPLGDKFAVSISLLYNSVGYERKPSYDITRRQYGTFTYQPFKNTRIRGSVEAYLNDNRRPNSITPRDYVTPWRKAGRPVYDPVTRMVTYLDSGRTLGPYVLNTTSPGYVSGAYANDGALTLSTSSQYVQQLQWTDYTRDVQFIDNGSMTWWNRQPSATTLSPWNAPTAAQRAANSALQLMYERRSTLSNADLAPTQYASWITPSVTDKSIYDWENVNLTSVNFGRSKARVYNLELEQGIFRTQKQSLDLSAGWFRQEYTSDDNYSMGQQQGPQLFIDTTTRMPDGSENTHLGCALVTDDAAQDTFKKPEWMSTVRAQLAYQIDFRRDKGWTKYLGHHRILGLWSKFTDLNEQYRYRNSILGGDSRYLPNMATAGWNWTSATTIRHYYYVGDTSGNVTHSPGYWGNPTYGTSTSGSIRTYNWTNSAWEDVNVQTGLFLWTASTARYEKYVTSKTLAMQNYFWDDRIVGTLGWRKDNYKARNTDYTNLYNTDIYDTNGYFRTNLLNRMTSWEQLAGTTKTQGIVVKPFQGFRKLGFLSGLSFFYNKSDNFNPPSSRQTDFFNNPLQKPTGDGHDYGIAWSLFDNKLTMRLNWFKTKSLYERNSSAASTIAGRVQRMDTSNFRSWAEYVVRIRNGQSISDVNFTNTTANPLSDAEKQQIADLTQLAYTWPTGYNIGCTQTNESKGLEYQMTYNPIRNWTMKVTVAKQEAIYNDVAPEATAWIAYRMPIWQSAVATDMPALATLNSGRYVSLRSFISGYGFNADALDTNTNGATTPQGYWNSIVMPDYNTVKALAGTAAANQRKWRANFLTNYQFQKGKLKGFGIGGAVRWESKLGIGYYGDTKNLNSSGQIVNMDITRPIYDKARYYCDAKVSYTRKVFADRSTMTLQLNVYDVFSNGGLMPIYTNLDGSTCSYRIRDPRTYKFSATFDF